MHSSRGQFLSRPFDDLVPGVVNHPAKPPVVGADIQAVDAMQALFPHRHVRVPAHEEIDVTGAILDFFSEQGISGVGREDVGGTAAQRVGLSGSMASGLMGAEK